MASFVEASVPPFTFEDCVQQVLECKGEPSSESGAGELKVIFPEFLAGVLPLAGGSIVKFDQSSWKLSVDEEVNTLIGKRFDDLSDLQLKNTIDSLSKFRIAMNRSLFKMREFKILESEASIKPPKLFFSYYQGDDSLLDDEKSSPNITRICKFKHIPYTAFNIALSKVVPAEASEDDFGNVVGASGRTFRELLEASEDPKEEDIIDLVLELFTVFNIKEDDIVKARGPATEGGYYTIFDKELYIKMPDVTGRDSAGFYSDIFDDDSNFYIETSKSRKSYGRAKFDSVGLPILATVDDAGVPLPDTGNVEIVIDTATVAGDIKNAYLSILSVEQIVDSSKKAVSFYSSSLEVFSVPMLTINDYFADRKPTIAYDLSVKAEDISFYVSSVEGETSEDTGIPYLGGEYSAENFFGEKNRAEILLANPDSPKAVSKNDRRFFSPKAYGAIPVLSGVRPRVHQTTPSKWIEMNKAEEGDDDDKVRLIFDTSKFDVINFDTLGNEASFALYLEDSNGQITKAAGENITISTGLPTITKVSPNGYKGSDEILSISEGTVLRFTGEGLTNAIGINVTIKGTDTVTTTLFSDSVLNYTGSSTLSTLQCTAELSYLGLEPGQEYQLSLLSVSGENGNSVCLYVNTAEGETQISRSKELAKFRIDEFSVRRFKSGFVSEIPILTETSAVLQLKSKQRLFTGNLDIFGYIGVPDKDVAIAIGGDDVLEVSAVGNTFYVPHNLEYEFSTSSNGDFARKLLNSRADLSIPGSNFQNFNLFPLLNAPVGSAIIFYNKSIIEDSRAGVVTPDAGDFAITWLGDPDGRKPFVLGPTVLGIVAEHPGGEELTSTFVIEEKDAEIVESFDGKTPTVGAISMFQKLSKLGIVFSCSQGSNLRRQLDFYIGDTKLTRLSEKIKDLGGGRFLAMFKNVNVKEEGVLEVRIEKRDKVFKYTSSGIVSKRASFKIDEGTYTFDQDEGILTLNESFKTFLTDGLADAGNNPVDLMFSGGNSGILLSQATSTETTRKFLYPLTISPNISTEVYTDGVTTLIGGASNETSELVRLSLLVKSGEVMKECSFSVSEQGTAVGYLNWDLTNAATIKCNMPEITLIKPTVEAATGFTPDEINGSMLKAGSVIKIRVKNCKKNFKVIFNELFSVKTKGPPRRISRGVYEATITVPEEVVGFDCIDMCVSTSNSRRLGAKLDLGEEFVRNIGQNMTDKLEGLTKDRIPDVDDLKDLVKKFPLRFLQVKLDKSLVPVDLIKSFCDFSWHLTADLKLALNGFQTLLIPIQVILCIIDVICSLLNPVKLASSVIRLFFCLYDLLLLLPQISVPVMFLSLVLHLLKLLECVILKVIEVVVAINEVIKAIEIATQQELWGAIVTLEEVLSEYLYELNVDLEVLEPVISVFAIFLQILELIFSFPCPPDNGIGDKSCGIQGTMLGGMVAGKVSPGEGEYDPSVLIPIAQYFTNDLIADTIASNSGSSYEEYALGDSIIDKGSEDSYLEAMVIDTASLRTTNGNDFEASFAASFTKSTKGLGEPTLVKFNFKDKLDNSGFFKKKVLDPILNRDSPFHLFEEVNGTLKVATGKGNFISPIDGETFITKSGDTASVKSLTLTFELPIMEPNPDTGLLEEVGIEEVTRTFDDVPRMALMDEEANLYFIEPNGIEFDSNDDIVEITARIINDISAPKFRFSRDDQEVDTDDDDIADDEGRVFDLPQLFFVDMRSISDELQNACYAASYNEFLLEDDETGDTDDIIDIVEEASDCVEEYRKIIKDMTKQIREDLQAGKVPEPMDLEAIAEAHQALTDCLDGSVDKICRFVMNPLNSSFLIEEDNDATPLSEFPEEVFDPSEFEGIELEQNGPSFTGAREYAGGIGDSHVLGIGKTATIRVTPRDSYDLEMPGDLSEKIKVNIISDTTGSAEIIENDNGTTIEQNGSDYYVKVRSNSEGEIKLSASVCGRTIAAVTYAGIVTSKEEESVDCVPEAPSEAEEAEATRPGALIKVDRILTLYYVRLATTATVKPDDSKTATTTAQTFGTALEN